MVRIAEYAMLLPRLAQIPIVRRVAAYEVCTAKYVEPIPDLKLHFKSQELCKLSTCKVDIQE